MHMLHYLECSQVYSRGLVAKQTHLMLTGCVCPLSNCMMSRSNLHWVMASCDIESWQDVTLGHGCGDRCSHRLRQMWMRVATDMDATDVGASYNRCGYRLWPRTVVTRQTASLQMRTQLLESQSQKKSTLISARSFGV